ncbi:MAG: nitronate monooxygenase [Neisseriaceae bacterium]
MFDLSCLKKPLLIAPMAGGPSTPQLVAAACECGASAFLAAGYQTAEQLAQQIQQTRNLTQQAFGVNLFTPQWNKNFDEIRWQQYRNSLKQWISNEIPLDLVPKSSDDAYLEKLMVVLELKPAFISFTFGCPSEAVIQALHEKDILVIATVTDATEAQTALNRGVDGLCVQGPEAGGHRATFQVDATPDSKPLLELLKEIKTITKQPLLAAGGIATAKQVEELLSNGAIAVQVGTLFLTAHEAGTNEVHKNALLKGHYTDTAVTRAFTGRPARGLKNSFINQLTEQAPCFYPELHYLTSKIRKYAAQHGREEWMALWAGTGFKQVQDAQASVIINRLLQEI